MARTLALAEQLISRRSITPDDGGCQALVAALLQDAGVPYAAWGVAVVKALIVPN